MELMRLLIWLNWEKWKWKLSMFWQFQEVFYIGVYCHFLITFVNETPIHFLTYITPIYKGCKKLEASDSDIFCIQI